MTDGTVAVDNDAVEVIPGDGLAKRKTGTMEMAEAGGIPARIELEVDPAGLELLSADIPTGGGETNGM